MAYGALMGAHQPPLEERHDAMHPRQKFTRRTLVAAEEADLMDVTLRFQRCIPQPAVRVDYTARLDGLLNKGNQNFGRSVGYRSHPDATHAFSILLSRYHNQSLVLSLTAPDLLPRPTEIGFVHLHS